MDDSPATANSSALSHRDFRRYLGAAFLAILATQIQSVAVGWQVYSIARTPLALGYVGLFQFLPMMACTIPAGHMADRFDRRLILVISNFCSAIAAGCFLTLALTRTTVIWPFYAVLVIFGASRAFAGPASQSLVPLLVPQDQFPQAVAWASSTSQVAVIAGPAIGGAIYILGPAVDYGVCLILFATVAIVMMGIRSRGMRYEAEADTTAFERITAGIAYVWRKPLILGAFSLDLFAVLLGGATALLPVYARDILHVGPLGLGVLRSAPALGAAMLGLALGQQALQRRAGLAMFACVAIFGVATIVFGLSENFALSMAALFVLGASDMVSVYVRTTLTQLATPDAMRGRVSAVNRLFVGASNELGEFESGVTATWFGTVPAVVIGGVGTLVIVAVWYRLFPSLREVDRLSEVTP
ncbi:MFS transporter [Candidatus Binatus sp.]|jgi:MFS family permease|uniref:MFS transporter n=1 Tax=Candidatus Binatus sp. TaxID=2811406 RepID=UPI003C7F10F0